MGVVLIIVGTMILPVVYIEYPKTTPTMPSVATIPLVLVTNASSVETFVIAPRPWVTGYAPTNTITYSVQGSSITSETPLNLSVTVSIDSAYQFLNWFVRPESVTIDNSFLSNGFGPDPALPFTLVENDSRGLVYSTAMGFSWYRILPTINLTEAGQLTGTALILVASKANPNSPLWFQGYYLQVRNITAIPVQSFQDLQLEKQTNLLENANLENNAQIQYADAETQYSNGVVTALTWAIIGFVVVDIGISFYDVSEKKSEAKK